MTGVRSSTRPPASPGVDPAPTALAADLRTRLSLISRYFDVEAIAAERFPADAVVRHYRQSDPAYRWLHSRAGCVHMALNAGGTFDRAGYAGQADIVGTYVARRRSRRILELGCGRGYNLQLLARRQPAARFVGVDLTPTHLRQARRSAAIGSAGAARANIGWVRGDFEALPLGAASVDLAFAVESLCHAADTGQMLAEVRRVLAPGGLLLCFDGFEMAPARDAAEPETRLACRLTEAAMAVDRARTAMAWRDLAAQAGLQLRHEADLTAAVLPNLRRFERLSRAYFRRPWLTRLLLRVAPTSVNRIAIAGLLMLPLVGAGIYAYRLLILERRS